MTHDPRDPPVRRPIKLMPAERRHPDTATAWAVAAIQDMAQGYAFDTSQDDDGDCRWLGRFLHSLYRLHTERGEA